MLTNEAQNHGPVNFTVPAVIIIIKNYDILTYNIRLNLIAKREISIVVE